MIGIQKSVQSISFRLQLLLTLSSSNSGWLSFENLSGNTIKKNIYEVLAQTHLNSA